jgi:hypothetical protein
MSELSAAGCYGWPSVVANVALATQFGTSRYVFLSTAVKPTGPGNSMICVFITAVPITKLFAKMERGGILEDMCVCV